MEIRLLRYFIAVAEELHFTRAAARLHVAQPALSRQIRELEQLLGTPLFRRSRRSVELTEAGVLLLPEARAVLERIEAATRLVKRAGKGEVGRLDIGFTTSSAGELLPRAVMAYRTRYPDVEVDVHDMTTNRQVEAIVDGDLDVGIVHELAPLPGLASITLRRDTLMAVLPAHHPLAERPRIALTDLASESFVLAPGHPHRFSDLVVAACVSAGFMPRIVRETADLVSRMVMVASGVGITLVPGAPERLTAGGLVYRPLTGNRLSVRLLAIWKAGSDAPLTKAFVEILLTAVKAKRAVGSKTRTASK